MGSGAACQLPEQGSCGHSVFQLEGDLPQRARVEGSVLTIPSARQEDTGIYVCTASNRQGKVTAFSMLKVRGESSAPPFPQPPESASHTAGAWGEN